MTDRTAVSGTVAAGYERVRDAFFRNLCERGDRGCALAAVVDGTAVVDLWGGLAAESPPIAWQAGTTAMVFSGSKGVVATLLAMLVERGALDLDAPVSRVWPEFAAAGKAAITVRTMLAHGAGLPGAERPLGPGDVRQPRRIAADLAAQRPMVPIGRPCYHAVTWGWLAGEVIQRVDGRTAGRLLAEDLSGPLDLDIVIGLPRDSPLAARRATLRPAPGYGFTALLADDPDPRLALVYANPRAPFETWNDPAALEVEVPAANAVATARSLAAMYGALVRSVEPLLAPSTLAVAAGLEMAGDDPLSGRPLRFGPTGYELAGTPSALGPAAGAFGHTGSGGSSHGAWPELRTGFSFVTADLRAESSDGRAAVLLEELHRAVAG